MDSRKIYSYYSLTPLDVLDSIDWARENFERYDGETSPLWNKQVQEEFVRLNIEHYYKEYEVEFELDLCDFIEETN